MTRLKAPEGMTSCSAVGKVYEVDESGHVEVPSSVVHELHSHGLTVAPEQAPEQAPAANPPAEDAAVEAVATEKPSKSAKPQLRK